jgi:transcriptional regulator with XRE-family HTH domain
MCERLVALRDRHGLTQRDVHDRPQLVSDWEHPEKPHAPNALHLLEQVRDPLSRPYALEVIACVLEEAEREESDPRQLSLLDLIAND